MFLRSHLRTGAVLLAMTGATTVAFAQSQSDPAAGKPSANSASPASPKQTTPRKQTDSAASEAAQKLSPLVEDVQIVGSWSNGNRQGVWRTVMMRSATQEDRYHFFVQQLAGDGTTLTVLNSKEIGEINSIDGQVVGYHADDASDDDKDGLTLFFDVMPKEGDMAETYQLNFFTDRPYDFGPATN